MLRLTFHGGAKMVTGSNYLLEHTAENVLGTKNKELRTRILIDCGINQGSNFCERHNWEPFPYDVASIDAVCITHAHIDHTGRLPKLVKDGYKGKIYSTSATRDAAELLLYDSDHILSQDAEKFKLPRLYDETDVQRLMAQWEGIEYHKPVRQGPFTVTLWNAGHILGSSFVEVKVDKEKIIFSGDLGNSPAPIIGPYEMYNGGATYALVESPYGDRLHERSGERKEILERLIQDTVTAGGTLIMPAFAMERTQEILAELDSLIEQKRIPNIPVFLDSPLAIKLTEIYKRHSGEFKEHADFSFPGLTMTLTTEESKHINDVPAPKMIIAGSGMSHGGRILHHEMRYLPDPKSTLVIVGYQAQGSLGRLLLDGAPMVKIYGEQIPVRCKIKAIGGYSAHADQAQLLTWVTPMRVTLKEVFVVQGEEKASAALAAKITDTLAVHTHIPSLGEEVSL